LRAQLAEDLQAAERRLQASDKARNAAVASLERAATGRTTPPIRKPAAGDQAS
jgi:hypothetical protein